MYYYILLNFCFLFFIFYSYFLFCLLSFAFVFLGGPIFLTGQKIFKRHNGLFTGTDGSRHYPSGPFHFFAFLSPLTFTTHALTNISFLVFSSHHISSHLCLILSLLFSFRRSRWSSHFHILCVYAWAEAPYLYK